MNRWLLAFTVLVAIVCAVVLLTNDNPPAPAPPRERPKPVASPQPPAPQPPPQAPVQPKPEIPDIPAPQTTPEPAPSTVSGIVIDEQNNPVPQARLSILTLDGNKSSNESADDGTFTLPGLNNNPPYIIQCRHPEFLFLELDTLVTPPCDPITIKMAKAPIIEGAVVDALTNAPIRKFSLSMSANEFDDTHDGERKSDEFEDPNGRFHVKCTMQDSTILIRCAGYADFSRRLSLEPGRKISITAAMQPFAIISVTVRNPEGDPIEDADIRMDATTKDHAYRTNADGQCTFQTPPGPCTLRASALGYLAAQVDVLCEPRHEHTVDVELNRGLLLVGTVTRNGVAQSGIHLSVNAPESPEVDALAKTQTDDQGYYQLTGLAPGLVTVHAMLAEDNSIRDYSTTTAISAPDGGQADIELAADNASITGTVCDHNNQPFPAQLSLETALPNGVIYRRTGYAKDGSYSFDNVPPGNISLIASQDNNVERRSLSLAPNAHIQCNFTLGGAGRITGRVLGNLDAMTAVLLAPANIALEDIRSVRNEHDMLLMMDGMVPLKDGSRFFAFENVKPGQYTLVAITSDVEPRAPSDFVDNGRNALIAVSVAADSPAHIEIQIP